MYELNFLNKMSYKTMEMSGEEGFYSIIYRERILHKMAKFEMMEKGNELIPQLQLCLHFYFYTQNCYFMGSEKPTSSSSIPAEF